jgi:hypothetical protein
MELRNKHLDGESSVVDAYRRHWLEAVAGWLVGWLAGWLVTLVGTCPRVRMYLSNGDASSNFNSRVLLLWRQNRRHICIDLRLVLGYQSSLPALALPWEF